MRQIRKQILAFVIVLLLLLLVFLYAINTGSLQVTFTQLFRGLFIEYDETVAAIYDLRFSRVLIAMMAGAALAAAGVFFQAVLKNPLADPGIIGVTSGAGFFAVIVTTIWPAWYFMVPIASLLGALTAFFLVYSLAWKDGLSPIRIILIGVAVNAMFTGLTESLNAMSGGQVAGAASIVNGNISQKTWQDVHTLAIYAAVGLVISLLLAKSTNLLALEDKTMRALGMNVSRLRILCSLTGVLLAGITAGIVGSISFLGLIAPHIARMFVGHDHRVLLPFSMLLGALMLLVADTLGRVIAAPYEISASLIMSVVGGPFFILLLRRRGNTYAN